jgi:hypothetical protein
MASDVPRLVRTDWPSPGMALEAQQALAQLDYYHGPVDGLVGPAYEEAVRKYQA